MTTAPLTFRRYEDGHRETVWAVFAATTAQLGFTNGPWDEDMQDEQMAEDDVAAEVARDGPRVDDGVEGADEAQDCDLCELVQVGRQASPPS